MEQPKKQKFSITMLTDYSYKSIDEGYYNIEKYDNSNHSPLSIIKQIKTCKYNPIISEIKYSSPSLAMIKDPSLISPEKIAKLMVLNGAISLSILTQPYFFNGSVEYLARIRKIVAVPLLMKDIIVSKVQIDSARKIGADYILLIKTVFDKGLAENDIHTFIDYASDEGISVLVEVHTPEEYQDVVVNKEHKGLIGINNRNLNTLEIDINNTERILNVSDKQNSLIISESGISKIDEILRLKQFGVDAFLIGTSIMKTDDIGKKLQELCMVN